MINHYIVHKNGVWIKLSFRLSSNFPIIFRLAAIYTWALVFKVLKFYHNSTFLIADWPQQALQALQTSCVVP